MPSAHALASIPALQAARVLTGRAAVLALPAILLIALAIRVAVVGTQTYVVFQDETFQYLEQGHRLAFGSGVLPWEFQDGIGPGCCRAPLPG